MRTGDLNASGQRSRIASRVIRSTFYPLLLTLTLTVLVTTFVSYQTSLTALETRVQRLGSEHQADIASALWQFDTETVEAELANFVSQPGIQRAVVSDLTGKVFERSGQLSDSEDLVIRNFSLVRRNGDQGSEELGTLTIEANRMDIWATVRRRVIALIAIALMSTVFATFLIIRQFNKDVIVPLVRVSDNIRNYSRNWHDLQIDPHREQGSEQTDELDDLVKSIHEMRNQILHARKDMETGERRLVQAAHLAGLAYCTYDAKMENILYCDENYATLHRKTVAEMLQANVKADFFQKLLDRDAIEMATATRDRVVNGSDEIQTYRLQFEDGEFLFLRQYFVGSRDQQGRLEAVHVIAQDITGEMMTQDMLLQSQKNEAIGKLTGGVAHDVNNILAVIAGNLEMSLTKVEDSSVIAYQKTALEAVDRGARLTQQLLSFARKQPLHPVVVDVARLIRELSPLLRTSAGETIDLQIVSDGGIWKTRTDPVQLEAVLLNLVVNARDAMPGGGQLTIEISNARLDSLYARSNREVSAGNYVCVSVTDSGVGMTDEIIEQSIEPFFTTKPVGEGTGLGLSMAYGFAKQSKGHLKIYSEPGRGTIVKLYLPKVQLDEAVIPPVIPTQNRAKLAGVHVLLIEDNEQLRGVIASQIESLGCTVRAAYNEITALRQANDMSRVDIILSDIVLPGNMDGRRLTQRLSEILPAAKIVFMSGFTENSIIHNGNLDEGIVFLQKPFRLNDLAQVLAEQVTDTRSQ
ncbi:MAG: response regulator [Granulosicoccus sp.]|nr:response regulator [Granulosicoccus sp.]